MFDPAAPFGGVKYIEGGLGWNRLAGPSDMRAEGPNSNYRVIVRNAGEDHGPADRWSASGSLSISNSL